MSTDGFWNCPAHGDALVYIDEHNSDPDDREEHWSCPALRCTFQRHVS